MGRIAYSNYTVVFPGSLSAASSNFTSNPCLAVDYASISYSWITRVATSSLLTVEVSNDDGFTSTVDATSWSLATAITASGQYTMDPGAKWVRFRRASMESQATVVFGGWVS